MKLSHRLSLQARCLALFLVNLLIHEFLKNGLLLISLRLASSPFPSLRASHLDFSKTMLQSYFSQSLYFGPTLFSFLALPFRVNYTLLFIFQAAVPVASFRTSVLHFVIRGLHTREPFNQ